MSLFKKIVGHSVSVIGLISLLMSILLAFVFISSVCLLLFGWFMFGVTDNIQYFSEYLHLHAFGAGGFYQIVQLLFLLDYLGLFIGANAFPSLILSCISVGVGQIVATDTLDRAKA